MLKFLPAIIFIQLVSSGLVLMAVNWAGDIQLLIVIVVIAMISAILFSFWFSSIAHNMHADEQAKILQQHAQDRENIRKQSEREKVNIIKEKSSLQDRHARERERILLDAEREKAGVVAESYRKIEKESRKTHAKANVKVGLAFAAVVGAGGVMIFSQLVTVGVMLMVSGSSALSGYVFRARQDSKSRKRQLARNERAQITDQANPLIRQKWLSKDEPP